MNVEGTSTRFLLQGIEPSNLLGFLALLGLLRALEHPKTGLRTKVRWTTDTTLVRPELVVAKPLSREELLNAADRSIHTLAAAHRFGGRKDLNFEVKTSRAFLEEAREDERADLATALTSDAAVKKNGDGTVEPMPLCSMFGQGHQHFMDRLAKVPVTGTPPKRGIGRDAITPTASDALEEALFARWRRQDQSFSFRWDPAEDVRYAYRHANPSTAATKAGTQHGANRLASVAVALLPAVPILYRGDCRLVSRGTVRGRGGVRFRWPIWTETTSLATILALLDTGGPSAESATVHAWYESRRYSVGKFMNWKEGEIIDRTRNDA